MDESSERAPETGLGSRKRRTKPEPEPELAASRESDRVREEALRLLAAQPRTRHHLAKRLVERGHSLAAVEAALSRLEAVGLVNDSLYAEGFIRRRLRLRPRPRVLLRRELRLRGVPGPTIESALDAFGADLDDVKLARAVLDRRRSRWTKLEPEVRRRRAVETLRRLGFSSSAIALVLRSLE